MATETPDLSVILPCFNEAGCLPALVDEVQQVLRRLGKRGEVVLVDDASTDSTLVVMIELQNQYANVQVVRHTRNCGQSAATATGFARARGDLVVVLDSDGQNDPNDLPLLLRAVVDADAAVGVRKRRQDSWVRKLSSRVGNGYRNLITGDRVRDAGCAFRVIRRRALRELPVFNGMHRFLPTLLRYQGYRVVEVEVNHRPRTAGQSKYGIRNRLFRGIVDCFAMLWWRRRAVLGNRVLSENGAAP